MGTRKRYNREFQLQASRLVAEQGYTNKEVAERAQILGGAFSENMGVQKNFNLKDEQKKRLKSLGYFQ